MVLIKKQSNIVGRVNYYILVDTDLYEPCTVEESKKCGDDTSGFLCAKNKDNDDVDCACKFGFKKEDGKCKHGKYFQDIFQTFSPL